MIEGIQAGVLIANVVADIYFRAKEQGIQVTPETLMDVIKEREAQADANDAVMGITENP